MAARSRSWTPAPRRRMPIVSLSDGMEEVVMVVVVGGDMVG